MFSTKIKTRFFEADPAGIIFYANIFNYIHSAYEDFISKLKLNFFYNSDLIFPILHAEADYHATINFGEILTINIEVTTLKKSSFELNYKIYNSKKVHVASAKTVHVCVSRSNFKKKELPEQLVKKLYKYFKNNL